LRTVSPILSGHSQKPILIGKSSRGLFLNDEEFEKIGQRLQTRQDGPFLQTETRMLRKSGEISFVLISTAQLDSGEAAPDYVVTLVDITERRLLEQHLIQQQKLEGLGMLAGSIAHDINNLLTPVLISADLMRGCIPQNEKSVKYLAAITQAGSGIKDLVNQILLFSSGQQGELAPLDLNSVVTNFTGILRRTIRENIVIDIKVSEEACLVMADRSRLEQILMNLAVNAQDAIEGGGSIRIETGCRAFGKEEAAPCPGLHPGRYVTLSFGDTGCGMAPKVKQKLFEPFYTTKQVGKGTGLGLSTVYGIVQQHSGHLEVVSEVGSGTLFRIFFPSLEPSGI
jgi:PAS domain S-box-containing protein